MPGEYAALTGHPAPALQPRGAAKAVTRRQPQARAGQVVRADRTAPCALPRWQLSNPARRDLRSFPRRRGIGNPARDGWHGHRDDLRSATSPATSWRGPGAAARSSRLSPAPRPASASTSARRYRGLPASLRISGSRPRRAQVATAAEVTPNNDATCRRVIRSSPMRPPLTCRSRGSGTSRRPPVACRSRGSGTSRTRHKRRPAGRMPRRHVHRGPLAGRNELVRDGAGHPARLCPGTARAECRTARCRLHRKFCCNLQRETSVS